MAARAIMKTTSTMTMTTTTTTDSNTAAAAAATKYIEQLVRSGVCVSVRVSARAMRESVHRRRDVSRLLEPGIFLSLRTNEKCKIEKKS